jgi:hypothetical protein
MARKLAALAALLSCCSLATAMGTISVPTTLSVSPATIAAHSDLTNSKKRRFYDGEWMIDPSFIAQDFEAVLMEWNDIVGFAF